jgi:hypothetical protein
VRGSDVQSIHFYPIGEMHPEGALLLLQVLSQNA